MRLSPCPVVMVRLIGALRGRFPEPGRSASGMFRRGRFVRNPVGAVGSGQSAADGTADPRQRRARQGDPPQRVVHELRRSGEALGQRAHRPRGSGHARLERDRRSSRDASAETPPFRTR